MAERKEPEDASIRVDAALRDRLRIYTIKARPKIGMREAANQALADYLKKHGA